MVTIPGISGWRREVIRLALGSLIAHKLRGALTILGIVIGITSVVAMISLIEGLNRSMQGQLDALGSDTIRIRRWDPGVFVGEIPDSLLKRKLFTEKDAEGIRETAAAVRAVAVTNRTRQRLRYGDKETRLAQVFGIGSSYLTVTAQEVADGREFTEAEIRGGSRVTMIGSDIQDELFPGIDPIGQRLRIGSQKMEITGVLVSRGKFLGSSLDNQVLIPRAALQRYFGTPRQRLYISARPRRPDLLPTAVEEITESLRRTRGLRPQDANDFGIMTQGNLISLYNQVTGAFFVLYMIITAGWSVKPFPTYGESCKIGMSQLRNSSAGPMPDSNSKWGDLTAPALRMISPP